MMIKIFCSRVAWDHADLLNYYNHSFVHLQPVLFDLSDISASLDNGNEIISPNCVDIVYEKIITALKLCAALAGYERS
jgi:hypothetical protein